MQKNFFKKWLSPTNEKQYIPPTGLGYSFGVVCICLMAVAFLFESNLIYLYTFILVGVGFSTIHFSHSNLKRMIAKSVHMSPVFANQSPELHVSVENTSPHTRYQIEVMCAKDKAVLQEAKPQSLNDLKLVLRHLTFPRGIHQIPKVKLQSHFPLHLLRNEKTYRENQNFIVFPERRNFIPQKHLMNSSESDDSSSSQGQGRGEDFQGHKPWTHSDSFRTIDWKVRARTGELWKQNFDGASQNTQEFFWEQTQFLDSFENRLSQMSYWIQEALDAQKSFHVHLSFLNWSSGWGEGRTHALMCWEKLALAQEGKSL